LQQYAAVVRGIVVRPGRSSLRKGQRVVVDDYDRRAALDFLSSLIAQWEHLPAGLSARPAMLKDLVPIAVPDTLFEGHYHAVEIWHKDLLRSTSEDMLLLMVETNL